MYILGNNEIQVSSPERNIHFNTQSNIPLSTNHVPIVPGQLNTTYFIENITSMFDFKHQITGL